MYESPSVLVVSLDPSVQEVWASLRADGITCQLASCHEEALELVETAPRPLLILDEDLGEEVQQLHAVTKGDVPVPRLCLGAGPSVAETGRKRTSRTRVQLEEWIAKPVLPLELALRAKALMVRAGYRLPEKPLSATIAASAEPADAPNGSLVVIFSVKGGTGKSTIAANLSQALAHVYKRKTLLVDADLWFGDLAVLLNANATKSLSDVCEGDELDLFGLPKVVVQHPTGVGLVLRPQDPAKVEKLNPKVLALSLCTYRALYDHVIVDTAASLDETNLQILDVADKIILVTTPEVTAMHNCSRFLAVAESLGYKHKIEVVLNRADSNAGIDADSIEQALQVPIRGRVVSAGPLVLEAANTGQSLLQLDPGEQEQITRDLVALAEQVTGEERPRHAPQVAPPARRGAWLPFLRRRA